MSTPNPSLDQIAAALQGYDPQALRAELVNDFLAQLATPVAETETIPVMEALGRVLAADLLSPVNVPPHDNSAMDGYAFDASQLGTDPLRLRVVGTAFAGKGWRGQLARGECLKIMTGAIMPAGADTVLPQELARIEPDTGSGTTTVLVAPGLLRAGDNRRFAGEDIALGQPALQAGERITPAALGLIASLGLPTVSVRRRLRVAYFSTGDEILSLGDAPREGAVFDSNRYTVFGLLTRLGVEVVDLGVVRDEPVALRAAFEQAARDADAIITSGGVSVGEADHTKAMMRELGDVAFWRIAMRPGRPMAVGRLDQALLFGLPGNPVAVMVTFLAFVRPALLRLMGCNTPPAPMLQAASLEPLRKKPGRTEYQRGIVQTVNGQLIVRTTGNQGSGVLSSMVQANGLIVLHHDQGDVAVGDAVSVMLFEGAV